MIKMLRASKHAEKRVKERASLPKSAVRGEMARAWKNGLKSSEVSGRVQRYMASVYFRHRSSTNTRIYNDRTYCFASDGTLITVMSLPEKLRTLCRKALKKKGQGILRG